MFSMSKESTLNKVTQLPFYTVNFRVYEFSLLTSALGRGGREPDHRNTFNKCNDSVLNEFTVHS